MQEIQSSLRLEQLDKPVCNEQGVEYASMEFFRNQVDLDTRKLMLLLKEVPHNLRATGISISGENRTLYSVSVVYRLLQQRGHVRLQNKQSLYPILDDPSSVIMLDRKSADGKREEQEKQKQAKKKRGSGELESEIKPGNGNGAKKTYSKTAYVSRDFFKQRFGILDKDLDHCLPYVEHITARDSNGATIVIHPLHDTIKRFVEFGIFRDTDDESDEPKTDDELKREQAFKEYLKELANGTSIDQELFEKLLIAFGPSRVVDIICRLRPEFRDFLIGEVPKVIPDYLGDVLVQNHGYKPDAIAEGAKHLSDPDNRSCLNETLRHRCIEVFLALRKADKATDESMLLQQALCDVEDELRTVDAFKHVLLAEVWAEVEQYYAELTESFEKPSNLVDRLMPDRAFPDMSQRINIMEIAKKKRMLIADEMSGGKSASAIIAKEYLNAKCAIICAPANVIETWEEYLLSDECRGNGSAKGYFKKNSKPRILRVENALQLATATADRYDYIIISHERTARPEFHELLLKINYDMFILDECHKAKNVERARSQATLRLMNQLRGDNEYVVLLSGTPIPNKIHDVAFLLKALYPERFMHEDNRTLLMRLINGGVVDLRNLLLPRMQMKKLADIVEVPEMVVHPTVNVQLTDDEWDIYLQGFLEDDQYTSSQKIIGMRQFLNNPQIVEPTPDLPCSKIEALEQEILTSLEHHDKVIVFVNGYVDGILRKNQYQTTIIDRLRLPKDVEIVIVDQHTNNRSELQHRFNTQPGKMVYFISGQTADVGVDYSGAGTVITYNKTWTEYEYRQQIGRANRTTRTAPLHVRTILCPSTIESGIEEHIHMKYQAIERLLRGIPLSQAQKRLLVEDTKFENGKEEVDEALAEYYLSQNAPLMNILKKMMHIGERGFQKALEIDGDEYASRYFELGSRCYQANINRMAGALIDESVRELGQDCTSVNILDMASGPEMLRRFGPTKYQDAITSLDMNKKYLEYAQGKMIIGSYKNANKYANEEAALQNSSFDYINFALAYHYTPECTERQPESFEVLREMNRLLKIGGRAIISLNYDHEFKNVALFRTICECTLGFRVVNSLSGSVTCGNTFRANVVTLEKVEDISFNCDISYYAQCLHRDEFAGLQIEKSKERLSDSRWIAKEVHLNGRDLPIELNESDAMLSMAEQDALREAQSLFDMYQSFSAIPREEIISRGMRAKPFGEFELFKKILTPDGVVCIKIKQALMQKTAE